MAQPNRLPAGGRIDRSRPLRFQFNGRAFVGHAGDTLASALLANDVHLVARSFKYHRPRGILSAGVEEPNALVRIGEGAYAVPNLRATEVELHDGLVAHSQNCWPGPEFDLGALADRLSALLPAGFYYKTFMWPRALWPLYERAIRRMAGMGRAPALPDPDRYEHRHAHCDVLVVGAGPAGLAAARAAARCGARVIVADDRPEPGGHLLGERVEIDARPALAWVAGIAAELAERDDVRLLPRTTVAACHDHGYALASERVADHLPPGAGTVRQRLWRIRARRIVLAAGMLERPLVFADNDRPGIMLAGAVRAYLNRYGVRPGGRAVIATCDDDAYRTALDLATAGAAVEAVVDLRDAGAGFLAQQARARGIAVLAGHAVIGTAGRRRLRAVRVAPAGGGAPRDIPCDLLAMSGGWMPATQLWSQSRGGLRLDPVRGAYVPDGEAPAARCAGGMAGAASLREAIAQGDAAGAAAAGECGCPAAVARPLPEVVEPESGQPEPALAWSAGSRGRGRCFVDFQNDVTAADVALAVREGYAHAEHFKRYTTAGMGTDQGRTGNLNALALLAHARGAPIADVGTTTARPPYTPLAFGAIAGAAAGALFDPVRTTPMHPWHVQRGAVFEDVGQWKRPRYYPRAGEDMRAAVYRECLAARNAIGMIDASTLGKIDVQGPDAAEFLDRVYCNDVLAIRVGRCRYGLMLGLDGMIFDDGVIARLGESHFLLSTTTGGAARVLAWLEEWRQTEWPDLRVWCTSVSEHHAQVGLCGPRAAELLAPLSDVDPGGMPPMSVRSGRVAGIPARVFTVCYAGGPGYEIAVPARRGYELWTTLAGAGERFELCPYGTEAMHVLRAEHGYVLVGQETDGTVTPADLGLARMAAKSRFFVGRRSLARGDTRRPDRKQLVGLLTEDPGQVLPEGAQVVADGSAAPPCDMLGHVTSSYHSANCGRSIALALIRAGDSRIGETLHVPLADPPARVTVVPPRFLPPNRSAPGE